MPSLLFTLLSPFVFAMNVSVKQMPLARGTQLSAINWVLVTGAIDLEDSLLLNQMLRGPSLRKDLDTVFFFNSPGGVVIEGAPMVKVITAFQAASKANKTKVTAYVDNVSQCSSLCSMIYMYFENRLADPAATFAYHAANIDNVVVREDTLFLLRAYMNAATESLNADFALWMSKRLPLFYTAKAGVFSAAKLSSEKAGVTSNNQTMTLLELLTHLGK